MPHVYGVIRTRPRRETTTARVAEPLPSRSVAFEKPSVNPSGEKVKVRVPPARETRLWSGPGADQSGVGRPRGRMVSASESTVSTTT